MTNYYSVTAYSSASALKTALELVDSDTVTFTIVPYKEGSLAKFLYITPASNKVS